jgi:3-phenylpropionate/trans-cinnamate dioxygenase ferredoxin component
LSDGWVEDGCVECPLHESRFDLRTGRPDVPPAREPIATYPVIVDDGVVYLVGTPS